jgi:glycosyltransferase involved in cell wall biosynthesis
LRKPLVSVVLIFLDAGEFLADAIESVFDQTHEHWELLLVDDGSSDGSTELARAVAREHPQRVTYVEHVGHANRGPSASRNAGIRAARGEYVAFLDADDVWQPRKLAEQVAILEKHPAAGLVYGAAVYWNSWRDPEVPDVRRALGVEENRLYPPTVLLTGALRSRVPTPCPSVVLVRRGLAVEVGGFDDGLHPFEDQAFLAKVYLRVPVYVAGESWILYRQHPASAVARMTAAGSKYDAGLAYFEWLERYLSEQGVTHRPLRRALRQKRRRYSHPAYDRLYRAGLQTQGRLRRAVGRERKAS